MAKLELIGDRMFGMLYFVSHEVQGAPDFYIHDVKEVGILRNMIFMVGTIVLLDTAIEKTNTVFEAKDQVGIYIANWDKPIVGMLCHVVEKNDSVIVGRVLSRCVISPCTEPIRNVRRNLLLDESFEPQRLR